ncbi:MAG: hypothetical protein ACTHKU_16475 [Verrucomicrobiota bacterium]
MNVKEPVYLKLVSRQQRVSAPTVMQAYATLETRGFIEARPRSGSTSKPALKRS